MKSVFNSSCRWTRLADRVRTIFGDDIYTSLDGGLSSRGGDTMYVNLVSIANAIHASNNDLGR
jgi:hypothetical protein